MRDVDVLDDRPATIAGINIGGTTTTVVGGLDDGTIVTRSTMPTPSADGDALVAAAVDAVRATAPRARSLGVAVGGPLNARDGVITAAVHLPGLHGVALRDRLHDALHLPVGLHHDAAACALAEWRWGPDAGVDGLAYLTCGTGFGVGLVIGGRVRYAPDGRTPEIGHVRYRSEGPPIFGKPGCFEGFGSANALALLTKWRDPAAPPTTPSAVAAAARAGDAAAQWALAENERAVGMACAMLADLLVLDVIVLGSLATYLGASWIDAVRDVVREETLAVNADACPLRAPMPDVQDRSALAAAPAADSHSLLPHAFDALRRRRP